LHPFYAIASELPEEFHLSGGRSVMNFVLTQEMRYVGLNQVLVALLAVIMITAAIKYLRN
jgi:hypothetical protein